MSERPLPPSEPRSGVTIIDVPHDTNTRQWMTNAEAEACGGYAITNPVQLGSFEAGSSNFFGGGDPTVPFPSTFNEVTFEQAEALLRDHPWAFEIMVCLTNILTPGTEIGGPRYMHTISREVADKMLALHRARP